MMHVRAQVLNETYPGLGKHARNISEELRTLLEALQHAIDAQTAVVRDCSSVKLAKIREARALNKKELQQHIDSYCRLLFQHGASDLKAPVMRRDRLCCSVKRGRSGVRFRCQCNCTTGCLIRMRFTKAFPELDSSSLVMYPCSFPRVCHWLLLAPCADP